MKITKKIIREVNELNSLIAESKKCDSDEFIEIREACTWASYYEFYPAKVNKYSVTFSYVDIYAGNKINHRVTNEAVFNLEEYQYNIKLYQKSLRYFIKKNKS